MFKQIPLEIKQEILQKVKEGLSASDAAKHMEYQLKLYTNGCRMKLVLQYQFLSIID